MHLEKGTFVMKKALYGTTALVAAAVVAGQADAASGLKLGITGFYRGAMGGSFGSGDAVPGDPTTGAGLAGRNNFAFRQEVRVNFTGSTTLDNGITVGVLVGINAGGGNNVTSNSTTRTNRAYMDISGKFGQVRFGDANSAYQSMCVGDPGNVTANFGLNSPNESFSNAGKSINNGLISGYMPTNITGAGTCFGLETRSTKMVYFSPTFGGFNFAVSFTPDHIRSAGGSGGGWAVGASGQYVVNYMHAGYLPVRTVASVNPVVGPVINNASLSNTSDDAYMVTVGGSYTIDAISIGLEGLYNRYNTGGGAPLVGGGSLGNGNATYVGASLNAAYALGPGISLEGQVAWTRSSTSYSALSAQNKVNAYEIDIGTAVNF